MLLLKNNYNIKWVSGLLWMLRKNEVKNVVVHHRKIEDVHTTIAIQIAVCKSNCQHVYGHSWDDMS